MSLSALGSFAEQEQQKLVPTLGGSPVRLPPGVLPPGAMTQGHMTRIESLHPSKDSTGLYLGAVLKGEGIVTKLYSVVLPGMVST